MVFRRHVIPHHLSSLFPRCVLISQPSKKTSILRRSFFFCRIWVLCCSWSVPTGGTFTQRSFAVFKWDFGRRWQIKCISVGVWEDGDTANHAKLRCLSAKMRFTSGVNSRFLKKKRPALNSTKISTKMLKNIYSCQITARYIKQQENRNKRNAQFKWEKWHLLLQLPLLYLTLNSKSVFSTRV